MAGSNDIFSALFGKVDSMGTTMVQTLYGTLSTALQPVFLAGMTCFVAWWGYEMLFGRAQMTAGAFVWRLGKLLLIYSFLSSWGTYQPLIVAPLVEAPNAMAAMVCEAAGGKSCGSSGASMSQGLTDIWTAGMEASKTISSAGGWTGVGLMMLAIFVMAIVGALVAVAVVLLMIGKMTMFMLLAIGPIILCFAMFNFTSHITDGWMRSLAQYALLPIIVYGLLGVMLLLLQGTLNDVQGMTADTAMTVIAPFLLMCVVTMLVLRMSLNIALGIAGGARLDRPNGYFRRAAGFMGRTGINGASALWGQIPGRGGSSANMYGSDASLAQVEAAARNARR
ncbi:type IV secretion system protein [Phyllobacterium sp. P30BS-XVII]|uniref:type IV secretion system protein n=1 Tax=Phyllobacterium sp. P30BS-XVII TaxID=2587046 RepID=UPI0015FAF213|nr:type IV secretion system protein [Phyllobacterium sp. P30BS-XVII]MBA8904145.1 type IV secretion system protein VirB6 [Phyllobacterium sp. P30BS-XVII]